MDSVYNIDITVELLEVNVECGNNVEILEENVKRECRRKELFHMEK